MRIAFLCPWANLRLSLLCSLLTTGVAQADLLVRGRNYEVSPVEVSAKGEWVVYPKGAPHVEANKAWLSKRVLVEIAPGFAIPDVASVPDVTATSNRGKFVIVTLRGGADAALKGARRLSLLPGVKQAEPMLARQQQKRFIPNDPYFGYNASNPGYQWHLQNTAHYGGTAGIDADVVPAWDSFQGFGVRIGIVDDGLEVAHPDLAPNADTVNDYDFNFLDGDPSPGSGDNHGTACAGVAAARGDNSLGGTGAAPQATLVGMRLIAGATTDADEADAFSYKKDIIAIKSNSWGPYDGGFGAGGPGPVSTAALEDATVTGRGGLGTVFVWAAGNGNQNGDDSNYDGWSGSPFTMAVSAITDTGVQAYYSEPGANILICAPSNGGSESITTTDRVGSAGYNSGGGGDYTDSNFTRTFGGTSSACPLAAGVSALILQANPNLSYRDVQEILVRTAKQNDPYDGGWVTNGAGFHFNVKYGAGLLDAAAATAMATTWTNLPALVQQSQTAAGLNLPIPDNDTNGASQTFSVTHANNLRVEHVTVALNATHGYRGQLAWYLTSPSGVRSRLARSRANDTESNLDWTFMTTHFWGERSEGNWKLTVTDETVGYTGTLNSAKITFYGTPAPADLPLPVITSATGIAGREGAVLHYHVTASNFSTSYAASGLPAGITINALTGEISGLPAVTGADALYFGTLSATNATGTTTVSLVIQILAAVPALAAAVDQPPSALIVPFGDAKWFSQTTTTHDTVDAAQSGDIADDEFTGMEMTVMGPTTISFQWKVSSEAAYDYLIFVVDGKIINFISGEQDWSVISYAVGPGTHNVDFDYFKDGSVSNGADAGWIDELVLTPITTPPVVTGGEVSAYDGVLFSYQITGTNAPTAYSATGLPAGLSIAASTGLISGTPTALGNSAITIGATNDFGTGTAVLTLKVGSLVEGLAAAVDAPCQVFTTSGNGLWTPQTIYYHDGVDAARSGTIGDLSQSVMTTQVMGPATGSFYWGISSENTYDFLRFYVDDVELPGVPAISGEVGWTLRNFTLSPGMHQLKWAYIKDDFVKSGLDAGFVDQLVITQSAMLDADNDGFSNVLECYFGTSDYLADQRPIPTMASSILGVTIHFPTLPGNAYQVECSKDMVLWSPLATITATSTTSSFTDPAALLLERCFYRVVIPAP